MANPPADGAGTRPLSLLVLNPMRGEAWGGVERWLMDLARGLRDRGHRVVAAGCRDSEWARRAERRGFPMCELPLRSDFSAAQARDLSQFMRAHEVDVVATKLHRGIRVAGLAARLAGRPPVVAFMGLVETRPGLRYRLTYELFLDHVVTLSERMREEIVEAGGLDPERVVAIPYGVRPALYEVSEETALATRDELGVPRDAPLALALGRLHLQKRFDLLLEAFARVRAEVPRAELCIAGVGRLRAELEARRSALGLDGCVHFAGFRREVAGLLAAADALVLSSDFEGLPMVILEAMAAGRPVVSTDVGSVDALVRHGESGLLVPRRDPPALAAAVAQVLRDPARARAMGEAGRHRVRTEFPLSLCIERTERHLAAVRRPR